MGAGWRRPLITLWASIKKRWLRRLAPALRLTPRKAVAAFALLLVGYLCFSWNLVCSNYPLRRAMANLCQQHGQGLAVGDMCPQFCAAGPDALEIDSCQTWHAGKEVVFSAILQGRKVFVKGRKKFIDSSPEEKLYLTQTRDGQVVLPDVDTFEDMVSNYLLMNVGIEIPSPGLFAKLWPYPVREVAGSHAEAAMKNLWALVQDHEYVFSHLFHSHHLFPQVLGSCGPFYVVERLEPLSYPSVLESGSFKDFGIRASVALAIVEFLDELDSALSHPIHLCDVKPSHFGLTSQGRVKYVDVDSVYLKPVLDKQINGQAHCQTHSDCHWFDCKGQCDLITGKCINGVANNNLQVVCEKVFLSRQYSKHGWLALPGILSSKHINLRLLEVLKVCANPSNAKDSSRIPASAAIRKELKAALQEVVDASQRLDRHLSA